MSRLLFHYIVKEKGEMVTATCLMCGERVTLSDREQAETWGKSNCKRVHRLS